MDKIKNLEIKHLIAYDYTIKKTIQSMKKYGKVCQEMIQAWIEVIKNNYDPRLKYNEDEIKDLLI